jgi:hypothetical protein
MPRKTCCRQSFPHFPQGNWWSERILWGIIKV